MNSDSATRLLDPKVDRDSIAYLSIQFPSAVEHYIADEVRELRHRGVEVIPCSVRQAKHNELEPELEEFSCETLRLFPLRIMTIIRAIGLSVSHWRRLAPLLRRILRGGSESPAQRLRALAHTWMGAYLAAQLRHRQVRHIHVHHG